MNMEGLMELQRPYKMYSADSGAVRFDIVRQRFLDPSDKVQITLCAKECPHEEIVTLLFDFRHLGFTIAMADVVEENILPFDILPICTEFYLTWYNNKLRIGLIGQEPIKKIELTNQKYIGYIKSYSDITMDIVIRSPTVNLKPLKFKFFNDGELHWVSPKKYQNKLPPEALIGGFENGEFIYIALATHNSSDCPGKYVPSKECAYVAWGGQEHKKTDYKILCGYNAMWVKCKEDLVPENAFAAGMSEVNNEILYVGRARMGNDLIVGKVHMLYKTLYFPYNGKEEEKYTYEILVRGDVKERAETSHKKCPIDSMKSLQPCI